MKPETLNDMINVAELLKDAPKGMKLYSPLFGDVEYCYIGGTNRRIWVCTKASMRMFSMDGRYCFTHDGNTIASKECLLFPSKDCKTWEGWKLPVQSKFNVGDWIVRGSGFIYEPLLITEIRDYYICENQNGERATYTLNDVHKNFHLWSIADAKDGDVICTPNNNLFIYKCKGSGVQVYDYCGLYHGKFEPDSSSPNGACNSCDGYVPATKEQRDLLFAKMKEAGYEWDSDKKELLKINNPKFKVADWIVRNNGSSDVPIQVYGLKKDRYLVTNMLGSKGEVMLTCQDKWRLWTIQDAKDGDVLAFDWTQDDGASHWEKIVIFKKYHAKGVKGLFNSPCVEGYGNTFKNGKLALVEEVPYYSKTWTMTLHPATKEQRDLLFAKMREAGCEWDDEKRELKKTKPHYDISNFKAGMPVLVRDGDCGEWKYVSFSHYRKVGTPFCAGGQYWYQCIPFEGNETLLGTTNPCGEEYINW